MGRFLNNARLLSKAEIDERYPIENNSRMAKLTREFVRRGFDIFYGENSSSKPDTVFQPYDSWSDDIYVTAAHLYGVPQEDIEVAAFTDMSKENAIYAAVRLKFKC